MSDEQRDAIDTPAVTIARPTNSRQCLDQAARVLQFAELEDHPARFDHYTTLAEKWMELAEMMGGTD